MKRKNEYQIHSPFVYRLYTQMIRGQHDEELQELGILQKKTFPIDELLEHYLVRLDESIMFIANDIHQNKKNESCWNTICGHHDVTLTIDLYDKGLVFYREGMEKQNFVLRS